MWTKAQLEALRAGASVEDVRAMADATVVTEELPEDPTAEVEDPTAGAEDPEAEPAEKTPEEVVAYAEELQGRVEALEADLAASQELGAAAEAELTETAEALAQQEEAVQALTSMVDQMTPAIMGMIRQRAVVLGVSVPDEYDTTEAMVEQYSKLEEKFAEKFKAGRQSMPTKSSSDKKQTKGYDSKTLAEMKAINIPA